LRGSEADREAGREAERQGGREGGVQWSDLFRKSVLFKLFETTTTHCNTATYCDSLQPYRVVPGHRNWPGWTWAGFFTEGLETR